MNIVSSLNIRFEFQSDNDEYREIFEDFDYFDETLGNDIDDRAEELVDDLNVDSEGQWTFVQWEIESYDESYADPGNFYDLNEYGEYASSVEEFGEAFVMRHEDLGELSKRDFEDSFNGTYGNKATFAEEFIIECYGLGEIPSIVGNNIDWEGVANDLEHDYDIYEGEEGFHVFRN